MGEGGVIEPLTVRKVPAASFFLERLFFEINSQRFLPFSASLRPLSVYPRLYLYLSFPQGPSMSFSPSLTLCSSVPLPVYPSFRGIPLFLLPVTPCGSLSLSLSTHQYICVSPLLSLSFCVSLTPSPPLSTSLFRSTSDVIARLKI